MMRSLRVSLSQYLDIARVHTSSINDLHLDTLHERFLLTAGNDASIALFDTQRPVGLHGPHTARPLHVVQRGSPGSHSFGISSVRWYPRDSGLFVTGSMDHQVGVWDSESMQPVYMFDLSEKVFNVALSPCATHALIAVATRDSRVRLCDLATGGFTHTLSGHSGSVTSVDWSPAHEFLLATGGIDGVVRLWDIRRGSDSCLVLLDQHNTFSSTQRSSTGAGTNSATSHPLPGAPLPLQPYAQTASAVRLCSHYGPVVSVLFSPDCNSLVSSSRDNSVHVWDLSTSSHMPVHFSQLSVRAGAWHIGSCLSANGSLLYHPSGVNINMYEMQTGKLLTVLQAHFGSVTACIFRMRDQALFSASAEGLALVWTAGELPADMAHEEDQWSDDER
eukprot:gnl/Spiro4/9133_TR4809_c0_g1_i1.p1 gnl/Spiro4/9133_TR4809_c0_g1~~gnl/Spiro4/9133_TR4809_c0_g1_i1.p1  ORF type:complete len:390 (+),score=80.45 gnl/Spiro4/9133_TR4809_c0_g1_i1:195-1364(+)